MSDSEYFLQVVRNLGKFGSVTNDTVVIIIQVFQIIIIIMIELQMIMKELPVTNDTVVTIIQARAP